MIRRSILNDDVNNLRGIADSLDDSRLLPGTSFLIRLSTSSMLIQYDKLEEEYNRLRKALEMITTYTISDNQCDNGWPAPDFARKVLQGEL